ncbi:MAG: DHH family phosphoesterase [Candidatus ainarchaeum sp.]|nr:DHH family phosphoesterase [Candidatus ainarchaeum sp.]
MNFDEACEEARKIAFSFSNPLIVHHYDADGITSGSIVVSAFRKEFRNYRVKWIKKLDEHSFSKIKKEKEIIFVDLGSGNEIVDELKDVLVIDHHQPKELKKPQINPLLYGIDGGTELSSSGTAYSVFKNNIDLAIVGAVGDMQYPLIGKNREILEQGVKLNEITVEFDLRLYGRSSRPLPQFLSYSDEVYIPGITYNESNAYVFLQDLGLINEKNALNSYLDLTEDERAVLKKGLINHLIAKGYEQTAKYLIGEIYLLSRRPLRSGLYDASEFSTILNACGRHGMANIGVGVCLGEEEAYKKSLELLKYHKTKIREGLLFARDNICDLGSFLFIDGRGVIDEGIIGIVCGMMLTQFDKKPLVGIAIGEENTIKISTRANNSLISKGLNLGKSLSHSSKNIGGSGGGHKIAAGASIPKDKLEEFLLEFANFISQSS